MPAKSEAEIRGELKIGRLMTGWLPVKAVRWLQSLMLYRVKLADAIRTERLTIGGIPCEWFIADATPDSPVILYLHGGGFVYGVSHLHRLMLASLTKLTGGRALMVDYRLAPEHPFPAGLNDSIAVYEALLADGIAPERIVIAGDSAGGNFTLGALLALRDRKQPLPAAGICLSPPVDMREHDVKQWTEKPDALLHPHAVRTFTESYIGQGDPSDPLMSPLLADLRGLPPLLVFAGDEERLCDDIVRFADAARSQNADVTLHIGEGMWHVWQLYYPDLPQAVASVEQIAAFVKQHAEQPASTPA